MRSPKSIPLPFSLALRTAILLASCALMAGCGGSGPSTTLPPPPSPTPAPTPTPSPTPIPTPTPTPTPVPTGFPLATVPATFNTAEFRESDGPRQHNAHVAWAAGHTGAGVTIAVIDTGIDSDSPEFAGRLSTNSVDLYSTRNSINGVDDHGTLVALVAAAARNGTGVLGMAWGASVMAIRADEPGSCTANNAGGSAADCSFLDADIARGVDHAVANGARVINVSLGGEGGANAALQQAVRDAAAAGVLVIVASGNDGAAGLDDFGQQMISAGNGAVIVVGAVDEAYQMADFSNRAGADTQFYMAARGDGVCCVYENGELFIDDEGFAFIVSGTSFAAPQVAGAAALLAQAFPNLTGQQIADILLRSAFDAGASGNDAVFGRGILDVNAAFKPIGATLVAGGIGLLSLGEASGTLSPAMGDSLAGAGLTTVVLDQYARAFDATLAGSFQPARQRSPLHTALAGQQRQLGGGNGQASVALTVDASGHPDSLRLTSGEAEQARVLAARVALQLSPHTQLGFSYAQSADGLQAQLQGLDQPAFMIAGSPAGDAGMVQGSDMAFALRHKFGPWGLTVSAGSGQTWSSSTDRRAAALRGVQRSEGVASMGLALDRRMGAVATTLGVTWMGEDESVLGAFFQPGLGVAGADSLFLDATARWKMAPGWQLGASLRQGHTTARPSRVVAARSRLTTRGFALDLERRGVFGASDALALRVSQPLRVEGGSLGLSLPTAWDYATLRATSSLQWLALAPSGRELDAELAWRGSLWGGSAAASLYWRRDPGHLADMPDDTGVALQWSRGF